MWEQVFASLLKDPSNDYVMLDASLVKAHQQAATGKKGAKQTRLWGVAEEDERPKSTCSATRWVAPCGCGSLLAKRPSSSARAWLVGGRASQGPQRRPRLRDANPLRALLAATGMEAVIPAQRQRKGSIAHDATRYRERNRIERGGNKLKPCRHLATHFDRRDIYFLSFLHLASTLLWLR